MKRLAAIACLAAGLALPVCAQHSGSHGGGGVSHGGGFASRSAPSVHGGSGAGFSRGVRAPSRSFVPPMSGVMPQMVARGPYGSSGYRRGYPGGRPSGFRPDRYRRAYISPYWPTYYGGYPYIWPGYPTVLDYNDYESGPVADYGDYGDQGYDNQGLGNPGYDDQGFGPQQPPPSWPALGPYAPPAGAAQVSPAPSSEDAVTLIFKDGRTTETIHNYVLTPTILYAGDITHRQVIPLGELDIPATEKVNREAGVDFHVPKLEVQTIPNPGLPDTHATHVSSDQ